jgi:hypothetical protein
VDHWLRLAYEVTLGARQPTWINNGSNLTVFGILGTVIALTKSHNCTEKGCWRFRWHLVAVEGTKYRTCHSHSTIEVHDRLHGDHARKHPEQHLLLNRRNR